MASSATRRVLRLNAIAVVVAFLLLELGARLVTGRLLAWGPLEDRGSHGRLDPVLGHVPRSGLSMRVRGEFTVTIEEDGTRSNGGGPALARPLTLVVGDSFAFGDEVDDAETWPAVLEQLTGARVVNGAVPGFGLDQAVLRAEALAESHRPDVVVVSFIPHDVRRCEMSIWSGNAKPWFDVDGERLVAHPPPSSWLRWTLGRPLSHSVLLDTLLGDRLQRDGPDTTVHERGVEVACLLMDRLAALSDRAGARIVVLAQPQTPLPNEPRYGDGRAEDRPDDLEIVASVLGCAAERGLRTLDLIPVVAALEPEHRARLFRGHGHNSPEGNRMIAARVRAFLAEVPEAP